MNIQNALPQSTFHTPHNPSAGDCAFRLPNQEPETTRHSPAEESHKVIPYRGNRQAKEAGSRPALRPFLLLLAVILLALPAVSFGQIYVDADASATGADGMTWGTAFPTLQDALDEAGDGDQIWVADGTYTPTTPEDPNDVTNDDRGATFQLITGVEIYGGFDGTEGSLNQRNWQDHPTVLSGDIGGDDDTDENGVVTDPDNISGANSFTVVTGSGTDDTALLDGFTITGGNADAESSNPLQFSGGGMYNDEGSPTLSNLIFSGNTARQNGGGMYNLNSNPELTNVTFSDNEAGFGGGMTNTGGSPTLTGVTFSGNSASAGGGMSNNAGNNLTLTNTTFSGNQADFGGGMDNSGGDGLTLTNVTFSGNTAEVLGGGGMSNFNSSNPILTNVTFSGNRAQGDFADGGGMNNINSNNLTLTNVTFSGNRAGRGGGGMSNFNSSNPILTNVTFSGNRGGSSGGLHNFGSSDPTLINVILWGNQPNSIGGEGTPTITYSLVQGQNPDGEGNLNGTDPANNPLFETPVDPNNAPTTDGNLSLREGSPAIHAGSNEALPADENDLDGDGNTTEPIPVDLAGNDRVQEGTVDLGAYESPFSAPVMPDGNNILYVQKGGAGDQTGSSWNNALPELREALAWADNNWDPDDDGTLQIWVADGTYTPTTPEDPNDVTNDDRNATFQLQDGVEIYGGFEGNETGLNQRNWQDHPTVLSGDIDGDDGTDENGVVTDPGNITGANSFTVVTGSGTDDTALLDGFTITAGNANSSGANSGGGMNNSGGDPMLINVIFIGNSAANGGGMRNFNGSPHLANVTFTSNQANNDGGGMFNAGGNLTLTNVTFSGNQAGDNGGGMFNFGDNLTLTNVTFSGNRADFGGGMVNEGGNVTIQNSIFWGNQPNSISDVTPTITYSLVQGQNPDGEGNLDGNDSDNDPLFETPVDPNNAPTTTGNLSLREGSPAINAGDNNALPPDTNDLDGDSDTDEPIPFDLAGNDRIFNNGTVDMGAYEFQGELFEFATKVTLTAEAGEGWRFLTSPVIGETYENFLGPIWTKGVPGSNSPGALFSNLYLLNQENYEWVPVPNMEDVIGPGTAFIVYVFEDDDFNGTVTPEEEFDKTLTSEGDSEDDWLPLDGMFAYEGLFFDDDQGPEGDSHFLLANPHPISLDFCEFAKTGVGESIWFWDPAAGGSNGDYVDLNCAAEDVHIAPFQAFWVRTTAENPALSIPEEAYLGSAEEGYFKQPGDERSAMSGKDIADLSKDKKDEPPDGFIVQLRVSGPQEAFTNTARILFSGNGSMGLDPADAPKLSPAGLAQRWLSFYSMDADGRAYAFQNVPHEFEEKVSIPLDIETTESGSFTLQWSLPEQTLNYFLRDNHSGKVMELREGGSYRFEVDNVVEKRPDRFSAITGSSSSQMANRFSTEKPVSSAPRFELLIAAAGIDGFTELGDVPEAFTLAQNYPNPFNPSTVISYQLPASSDVRLEVYDMIGRRVATLVDGQVAAGRHTVNFDARGLSSGVYLYRLQAGGTVISRKLTVMK